MYANAGDGSQRRKKSAPPAGAPYVIPLGASTPLGAAALAHAATELFEQIAPPDVIVHASSSGGTQAGLVAGCALANVRTRVIGISADEPSASLTGAIRELLSGLADLVGPAAAVRTRERWPTWRLKSTTASLGRVTASQPENR